MVEVRDLLALARQAAAGRSEPRVATEDAPPRPGEVFVHQATASWDVEWAVLANDAGGLLVVPADASSLVGSADFAARDKDGHCLTLRCRLAIRSAAGLFLGQARTAVLVDADLLQAQQRQHHVESREETGTFSERQLDEDPEYVDWIQGVLMPAVAVLRALEL